MIGESIRPYLCKTHPSDLMLVFLSGKRVARMIGEVAEYDLFLSCRVNSDMHSCKSIYEMLTEKG